MNRWRKKEKRTSDSGVERKVVWGEGWVDWRLGEIGEFTCSCYWVVGYPSGIRAAVRPFARRLTLAMEYPKDRFVGPNKVFSKAVV